MDLAGKGFNNLAGRSEAPEGRGKCRPAQQFADQPMGPKEPMPIDGPGEGGVERFFCSIADGPYPKERETMTAGPRADDSILHIDNQRARRPVEVGLIRRGREDRIDRCEWTAPTKSGVEVGAGRLVVNDNVATLQLRRQTTRDARHDDHPTSPLCRRLSRQMPRARANDLEKNA